MDIWVLIHVNDDNLGELDNPANPTMSDIRAICHEVDTSDIQAFYDDRAIRVEGVEA